MKIGYDYVHPRVSDEERVRALGREVDLHYFNLADICRDIADMALDGNHKAVQICSRNADLFHPYKHWTLGEMLHWINTEPVGREVTVDDEDRYEVEYPLMMTEAGRRHFAAALSAPAKDYDVETKDFEVGELVRELLQELSDDYRDAEWFDGPDAELI